MSTTARVPGLRGFIRERAPAERCELCSAELSPHPHHEHLFEPSSRQIHCSCTPCAILFPVEAEKRYRRVPRRLWYLQGFAMSDAQWESLAIPVNMAFLHTSAPAGTIRAFYPSPAGATESMLTLEGWDEMVADNPILAGMVPDIEALLVNRVGGARDHYLAPIDKCFELVGLIRISWRGLSGGQEVWERIDTFFAELRSAAQEKGAVHA
jgi:hypothetical protein